MKISTLQDLANFTESSPLGVWIVDNLLRTNRRRISLLCGSPHAGKSTLARQLATAVVYGKPFLGRDTQQSKVAYWCSEDTGEDIKGDFLQNGMALTNPNLLILESTLLENNLIGLDKCLEANPDIRLVVFETLDDFLQVDDLDNNTSTRKAFEKLDAVVQKHTGCCFVALHHFKKSDEQHGSSLHKILGATVIAGRTDCKIFMRGCGDTDPRRVISTKIRKGISIEPTYLVFDEATQTSMLGRTIADERAESERAVVSMNSADLRQKCISVVAQDQGLNKTDAYKRVGGHRSDTLKMFDNLISEGAIKTQKGGKTGTAILLYIDGAEPKTPSMDESAHLEENRNRLTRAQENAAQYPTNPYWQDEISRLTKITEGSAKPSRLCQSCDINKAKGTEFNTEWGERFCSATCAQQGGIPCTA